MKFTTGLMFLTALSVTAGTLKSQTTLTLNMKNASLVDVFKEIERTSDFGFFYKSDELDNAKELVSIQVENAPIADVLRQVLDNEYNYRILDDNIVLISKNSIDTRQQKKLTGTVTDATSGDPLPGVYVIIDGTQTGVITDEKGMYSIEVPNSETVLAFSFIGYISEKVTVGGNTVLDIQLIPDIQALEEVVVIGYGTMKKADLTGSVVSVNMKGKDMSPNIDLAQALQGSIAGINATGGGMAGKTGELTIRGQTSLSANDDPLIVIDGIIFNGSISDININDIGSIDILKDASAAAVYGSRSANGVILITSKRGKSEKPQFDFNMSYGFQDISNTRRMDVMNAEQYALHYVDYAYQQQLNAWYATSPTDATGKPARIDVTNRELVATYLRSEEEKTNYLAGNYDLDWVDKVLRTAPIQNYNLSVSGQTDKTNYFLSGSYTDQTGVLLYDDFSRLTLRANFENKIANWLTVGFNTSYAHLDYSGYEASMYYAMRCSPLGNYYDENGNPALTIADESYQANPVSNYTDIDDVNTDDNLNILGTAKINFPFIKGLTYQLDFSKNMDWVKHNDFYSANIVLGRTDDGYAKKELTQVQGWLMNNILSYSNEFGGLHKVNATFLFSRENRTGDISNLIGYGFDNEALGFNSMELATNQQTYSDAWEENSLSVMARANYTFKNRYMLTATFRRDGFSGFGANKKYASFPSISLAWVTTEESFMNDIKWLDYLKIRASYGLNGNQGIGRYASAATMGSTTYVFGSSTAVGVKPSSLGNADLGWESTASLNLGLDFTILNQRISGQVDVYSAETSDVLVKRSITRIHGYSSVYTNIGGIKNKGVEISLTSHNIKSPEFTWDTRFTFSRNRNKITKLYDNLTEDTGNEWFVGENINSHYDYTIDGVWQEQDLYDGNIHPNYYPGMYKFRDIDESGTITADDRSVVGTSDPNFRFSISNSFSYKNFTLSIFINSIQGGNGYYIDDNSNFVIAGGTDETYRTNCSTIRPYWTPDNPVNNSPAIYYASPVGGHGIYEDRSFVRLQDVTLAYNFKQSIISKLRLINMQVYLSGKNLHTWTDWSGWDPEIYDDSQPMMRSIIGGVKVSF